MAWPRQHQMERRQTRPTLIHQFKMDPWPRPAWTSTPWQPMDWALNEPEAGTVAAVDNPVAVTAPTAGEKTGNATLSLRGETSNPCRREKGVVHC